MYYTYFDLKFISETEKRQSVIYEHEFVQDDFQLQLHFAVIDTVSEYYPAHWHNHLEILCILEGNMSACVNDRKYELDCRDILIINPREIHSTQIHGRIRYLLLQIPLEDLKRLMPDFEMLYFEEFCPHGLSGEGSINKMEEILMEMKCDFESKEDGYQLLFTSLFYEFLYELYKNHTVKLTVHNRSKDTKNILRIEQIMDYVKFHYQGPITLDEISGSLSISSEYFCRLFKKYTNQTFLEYVNTVRLVHFYNDLKHSDDSISYLMDKNGITNYKVFIRMFKKAYGTTPNKIRNSTQTRAKLSEK